MVGSDVLLPSADELYDAYEEKKSAASPPKNRAFAPSGKLKY
jgi:hypothetical protein